MKFNTGKYHLLITGDKYDKIEKDIREDRIWETSNIELLGIAMDNQLKFDKPLPNLCSKVNNKFFDKDD